MNPVETIAARLSARGVEFEATDTTISVGPQSEEGFPVSLSVEGRRYIVSFDGWHEHFDSHEEATACFAFGMSAECRLKIECRGHKPYRWTVESLRDGAWVSDSRVGLLFSAFWKGRRVVYRQNDILKARPD